ncbi:McrC family protein [uncultured Psychrobacter sp.]|uniref:McrC family protein n=1 Tax=uncultured Psychrobacter sp. TaxID=259303 RepID=UPI003459BBF5
MTHYNRNLASTFEATLTTSNSLTTPKHTVMSVFEHQRLTVYDFVQKTDFAWLLAQEFAVFTIRRQRGQWQLKVGHYIGVIILPSGIALEILPKAVAGVQKTESQIAQMITTNTLRHDEVQQTRQWVQRMLSDLTHLSAANKQRSPHTKNLGQLSQHLTPLSMQTLPLSQWLVLQFLRLLADYQPSQSYQTQTSHQVALQGKLLIKEQLLRNHHQPHKFACEISQLSPETLANRLIKSALELIEPLINTYQSHDSHALLARSKLIFWRQITAFTRHEHQRLAPLYLQAKQQLILQPMSRQQCYAAQQLLDLAYWLLRMQQSTIPTGNGIDPQRSQLRLCLLINMNQAFEQWASLRVAAWFEGLGNEPLNLYSKDSYHNKDNQLPVSYQTLYQPKQVWLKDKSGQTCLTIRPDLLVNRVENNTRSCSHVIDIKWKYLAHARDISASDAYQLTSYAQAYQAEQIWLVYPVTDAACQPVALRQYSQSNCTDHATLWLMPFNVTTASLNSWPE